MSKKIRTILSIILLLVAVGCGVYLFQYYYKSNKSEKEFDKVAALIQEDDITSTENSKNDSMPEVTQTDNASTEDNNFTEDESDEADEDTTETQPQVSNRYKRVYENNKDFVGWLSIPDTRIDYPVMYTPNDSEYGEYYIHRDFDGNYSAAGVPFIDRNCDPYAPTDNVIIYGHNMNAGTMFHDLLKFEKKDFYNSHKTFHFDTIYENAEYEIVAVFYGEIFDDSYKGFKYYEFVNAADEKDFNKYVKNLKKMSIFDTGVDVKYGDKLLTLSTCAYHVENGRFAIVAKKIED